LEAHALVAAGEAVLDADDLELVLGDAHVDLTGPAATACRIFGIEVVVAGLQFAFDQRGAGRGRDLPPAFRRPPFLRPITDRDADQILRAVADPEVRSGGA